MTTSSTPFPEHPSISVVKAKLRALYDQLEVGKVYSLHLALTASLTSHENKVKAYKILSKHNRNLIGGGQDEWAYSVCCQDPEGHGIIYHWIVPASSSITQRIVKVEPWFPSTSLEN